MTGPIAAARWAQLAAVPVLAFLAGKLASLVANLRWFPTLRTTPGKPQADGPPTAGPDSAGPDNTGLGIAVRSELLVPLRNEAGRIGEALPGLIAAGFDRVTLLDDESDDGTAAVVRELLAAMSSAAMSSAAMSSAAMSSAADPSGAVRLLAGRPRPSGWVGKTWACAQLADVAAADVLVFCDADVHLAPGAAASILVEMKRQGAEAFSVFPRQRTGGWAERLLVPLIDDVVLCFLPFGLLRAPVPQAAVAHGALFAFTSEAYRALGGFAAVRGALVEDVAMAHHVRRAGRRLGLALGGDVVQARMYRTAGEVVAGLGKGLVPVAGGRRWPVVAVWAWHVIAYTVPLLVAARRGAGRWRLAAALGIVERLLVEAKTGGRDWSAAALIGLSPLAAGPVVVQAMRRQQTWRGRSYA